MMHRLRTCRGSSLLELALFIGILAIVLGTVMAVSISTEESRLRQRSIAEVEQRGIQLVTTLTKSIRRAEVIVAPAVHQTGAILVLQMRLNGEFPTIVAKTSTGNVFLVQKTTVETLLSPQLTISNLVFRNVGSSTIALSFDLKTIIPLVHPLPYSRHFDTTATLFPNDKGEAGGCGTCPSPNCINHAYTWYHCDADVCAVSPTTFSC